MPYLTKNTPVCNNNILSRTVFSTLMSTLHDGSLGRQKMDNSRVVIQECQFTWLSILSEMLCLTSIVTKFHKDLTHAVWLTERTSLIWDYQLTLKLDMCTHFSQLSLPGINAIYTKLYNKTICTKHLHIHTLYTCGWEVKY